MTPASTDPPRRRASWRVRLLLIAGSALVTLMLCESGARAFAWRQEQRVLTAWQQLAEQKLKPPTADDTNLAHFIRLAKNPRLVYEHIPNLKFRYMGVDCATNEYGFRGPSVALQKPAGCYRVVVLGDSVAFGHGVAECDCFPRQLEAMLRRACPGKQVEVINTGVSGYNTAMEVAMLVDKGLQFAPDLVVYHYIGNDLDLPNLIWIPQNFWSLRHSFLWEEMAKAWRPRDPWSERPWGDAPSEDGRFVYKEDEVAPQYRDMVGLGMFRRELTRLRDLGEQHHFRVIVSAHKDNPPYVAETCKAVGLPFAPADVAIYAYMKQHGIDNYYKSELVLSDKDPHPTPKVHRMIAETIMNCALAENMLPQ